MEEWKDVIGYEWAYIISSRGVIISLERKISYKQRSKKVERKIDRRVLKQCMSNNCWYFMVKIGSIHTLLAQAFIANPNNKPCVNHKNWIKTDNRLENLEWCTNSENQLHAYENWLQPKGEKHYKAKWVIQVGKDWAIIRKYSYLCQVRQYGFLASRVSACCLGKIKSYKGFLWYHQSKSL